MKIFKTTYLFAMLLSFFSASIYACDNTEQKNTMQLIKTYYEALNNRDMPAFFAIMDKNVVHDINQGPTEKGIDKFKSYMTISNGSFNDKLSNLVIMVSVDGKHAAAQWVDHGVYFKTAAGMTVHATNQKYTLNGGHFFEIHDGKLSRVTTYYNNAEFDAQVK